MRWRSDAMCALCAHCGERNDDGVAKSVIRERHAAVRRRDAVDGDRCDTA